MFFYLQRADHKHVCNECLVVSFVLAVLIFGGLYVHRWWRNRK